MEIAKERRMGVHVCVCACVEQIRKRRRIRSLRGAEHGGAMEETAACRLQQPRWAGRRGNAQNKGFLSSAHLSSSPSLAHVAPPLQGPPGGRSFANTVKSGSNFRFLSSCDITAE